ncbi:hypothetical protein AA18889_1195 [Acetobacter senegalensis DSM 18889]|nr:hypothetical protein AA18889_1195 [Acetobacter senegalensis DSM 18889]
MQFDIRQLAQASDMTEANIVMLMNRMPELFSNDEVAKGHGKKRLVSVNGLRRIALVGAISNIGAGPTQAAKFVITFIETMRTFMWASGKKPQPDRRVTLKTNLLFLDDNLEAIPNHDLFFTNAFVEYGKTHPTGKELDDIIFLSVMKIMEEGEKADLYERQYGDTIINIFDGEFVTVSKIGEEKHLSAFRMQGWGRGEKLTFKTIIQDNEYYLEHEKITIDNPKTKISINISLAIRTAFMRSVL